MPERHRRPRCAAVVGLAGAGAVSVAGPRLTGGAVSWWFSPGFGGAARVVLYAGMALLTLAWLAVSRSIRSGDVSSRELSLIGALWALPLLLGAPLFSHDVYSYLAQGTVAHLGLDPYARSPSVLAHLGHPRLLAAVSPFWRHTTAPYGPLFIALVEGIVALTGSHLVAGALLVRVLEIPGLILLAIFVPRLARRTGASPAWATWLTVLSPLFLLQLVAPGHNDLLMAGLMVAGVVVALEGRPAYGIAICALATTIKLPALAAVLFIGAAWLRSLPGPRERLRALTQTGVASVGVLGLVSLLTGLGLGWISSSVFSTPDRVHLAITPSTALGWTVASLLRGAGVHAGTRSLESAFGVVGLVIVLTLGIQLLWRVRFASLARWLGIALVAFALGGPAAWPWYFAWGIVLLAACRPGRWWIALPAVSIMGAFVVKPDGILVLPIQSAPVLLGLYLATGALVAWRASARRRGVIHAAA